MIDPREFSFSNVLRETVGEEAASDYHLRRQEHEEMMARRQALDQIDLLQTLVLNCLKCDEEAFGNVLCQDCFDRLDLIDEIKKHYGFPDN